MGVGPAGTPLVDSRKSKHFPMAKRLEEAGVLLVGKSLESRKALHVGENPK